MRGRRRIRVLAFLWLASAFGCGGSSTRETPALPASRPDQWQAALNSWPSGSGHQGVSASVILRDGSEWDGVAGGSGPREPLRTEHLIRMASITKTVTVALILQLADEGLVSLDDPVSRWLEARPQVDPLITLRQLLNHSNGLDNSPPVRRSGPPSTRTRARVFTPDELLAFIGRTQIGHSGGGSFGSSLLLS